MLGGLESAVTGRTTPWLHTRAPRAVLGVIPGSVPKGSKGLWQPGYSSLWSAIPLLLQYLKGAPSAALAPVPLVQLQIQCWGPVIGIF